MSYPQCSALPSPWWLQLSLQFSVAVSMFWGQRCLFVVPWELQGSE